MLKRATHFLVIFVLAVLPIFAVWTPFILRLEKFWQIPLPSDGLATIVANYDGPLYLVVAKTFYNKEAIAANFQFPLPLEYYAAHFPLFPALIRLGGFVTNFGYAMLAITILSSILAIYFFQKFIGQYVSKTEVLWLSLVFALFPARWLIVRSVGSPEPLFIASIIASVYYFQNKKYLKAGIWGAVAQLTKSPGILLFVAYAAILALKPLRQLTATQHKNWFKTIEFRAFPILLIPLALLGVFTIYRYTMNDFLAYFHSGDNIHLLFPPFQIFNYSAPWVGTFWLEEVLFIYLFGVLGILSLIKQKQNSLAVITGVFFASLLFVSHRDLMRYALPIVPFIFAGFAKPLTSREFKIAFILLLLPIYLLSLAYISQNVMPIANWTPLL
jgi:Gpi18-like mannosyltransferase